MVLLGIRFVANLSLLLAIIQVAPPTQYPGTDYTTDEEGTQLLFISALAGSGIQVLNPNPQTLNPEP